MSDINIILSSFLEISLYNGRVKCVSNCRIMKICKLIFALVEQRLIERNQEPAICDKIKDIMQEAGFDILSCVKKHTYPGKISR